MTQQPRQRERVQVLPLEGGQFALAHRDLEVLGRVLARVQAEAAQRGEVVKPVGGVVPVGDGRVMIHVRRTAARPPLARATPKPPRRPLGAPLWVWALGGVAATATCVVGAAWLVLSWIAAHTAELAAAGATVAGFVVLGALGWFLLAGRGGGSGHCSGANTGH